MPLLPRWLQKLFKKRKGKDGRAFASEVDGLELVTQDAKAAEWVELEQDGGDQNRDKTRSQDFEIFPEDLAVRKQWFSLTVRERQVVALVCMGYLKYEIATILLVGYPTIQTQLQKIFRKFGLRSRNEVRAALVSWRAEDWWNYHHY